MHDHATPETSLTTDSFAKRLQTFSSEVFAEQPGATINSLHLVDNKPRLSGTRIAVDAEIVEHLFNLGLCGIDNLSLERVWNAAASFSRLAGQRWANPIMIFFVAGYYGHVADLLISTPCTRMDSQIRAAMAEALLTAPWPSADNERSVAQLREKYMNEGLDELSAQEGAEWEAALSEQRPDREHWAIDGGRYAAFLGRWKHIQTCGIDMQHPAIASCQLIAGKANFNGRARDRTAVDLITKAFLGS